MNAEPVLTLQEAFRAILRVEYRQRPSLADEITNVYWFWYWKPNGTPAEEFAAAEAADKKLRDNIRQHKIRLRGVLKPSEPPIDIDPIDAAVGEFSIWKQTLEVHTKGIVQRKYQHVHCVAADV